MNRYRKMMSLKNEYVQEKSKDEGFQASWLHIAFLLMWLEEHFGVNPNVSVLSQEAVTDFFTWIERDLSYSARTRLSIATALGEFLTFAYEKEYLEHDLTVCIPAIHA